jgi:DNA primase
MGIVDEDVVRVREAADIVQVISAHTQLKRVGRSWSASARSTARRAPRSR